MSVCLSVGQSVGPMVCLNFKYHFQCSYRSTCLFIINFFYFIPTPLIPDIIQICTATEEKLVGTSSYTEDDSKPMYFGLFKQQSWNIFFN